MINYYFNLYNTLEQQVQENKDNIKSLVAYKPPYNFMGEYVHNNEYHINDCVYNDNGAYICILAISQSLIPPETDIQHFDKIVYYGGKVVTQTYLNTELAKKADTTTLNTELAKKVDKTSVKQDVNKIVLDNDILSGFAVLGCFTQIQDDYNTQISKKSDTTTVNTELAKKADTITVNTELAKKADTIYVNNSLNEKQNILRSTYFDQTQSYYINNLVYTQGGLFICIQNRTPSVVEPHNDPTHFQAIVYFSGDVATTYFVSNEITKALETVPSLSELNKKVEWSYTKNQVAYNYGANTVSKHTGQNTTYFSPSGTVAKDFNQSRVYVTAPTKDTYFNVPIDEKKDVYIDGVSNYEENSQFITHTRNSYSTLCGSVRITSLNKIAVSPEIPNSIYYNGNERIVFTYSVRNAGSTTDSEFFALKYKFDNVKNKFIIYAKALDGVTVDIIVDYEIKIANSII